MTLEVHNIGKSFGGFRALDQVSLGVPEGGLVGLIGPNGAGKSTLFSVISGFVAADEGTVKVDGRSLDGLAPPARVSAGLCRTFQVPREFRHLTVRENLMVAAPKQSGESLGRLFLQPARIRVEEEANRARVAEIIRFLKLDGVADSPSGTLSGGQKKLLELGRALMVEPKLILLDEPFAGVNPVLIAEIADHVRTLNARGIAFLIVEHNLDALARLVRHLYVMDRGRIMMAGEPDTVLADTRLLDAYMGGAVGP
ncbi:MAG TPA: ABC transporter ATP-binding protein [Alphaproteobacteria bacterium]|nr:ABC transporter ATP-binding protein [Alphaproteobacteria bacterium]